MHNPFVYHAAAEATAYQRAAFKLKTDGQLLTVGAFISTMELRADDSIGTAATDCMKYIVYSPAYLEKLEKEDKRLPISVFIHEATHKKQGFFVRFEAWAEAYPNTPRRELLSTFNIAADYLVNHEIKHRWRYPIHETWYYRDDFDPNKYTVEGIANYLMQNQDEMPKPPEDPESPCEDGQGGDAPDGSESGDGAGEGEDGGDSGGDGEAGEGEQTAEGGTKDAGKGADILLPDVYDGDIENKPTPQQLKDMEAETREDKAEAMRMAQGARGAQAGDQDSGTDPFRADMEGEYVTAYDFHTALMQHANVAVTRGKFTWFKPSPYRKTSQGIPLPSRYGKAIGEAVFIIDSSGSTSGALCKYFLDETYAALRNLDYERAVVIWCDRRVNHIDEYTKAQVEGQGSLWDGNMYGGGGTRLMPAIREVLDNYPEARCVTYLTDGAVMNHDVQNCIDALKDENPTLPVLWLLDNKNTCWAEEFQRYLMEYGNHNHRVAFLPNEMLSKF